MIDRVGRTRAAVSAKVNGVLSLGTLCKADSREKLSRNAEAVVLRGERAARIFMERPFELFFFISFWFFMLPDWEHNIKVGSGARKEAFWISARAESSRASTQAEVLLHRCGSNTLLLADGC